MKEEEYKKYHVWGWDGNTGNEINGGDHAVYEVRVDEDIEEVLAKIGISPTSIVLAEHPNMLIVKTKEELRDIILNNRIPLHTVDVSNIKDFSHLFDRTAINNELELSPPCSVVLINGDISGWWMENATNVKNMFYMATLDGQNLSSWDLSNLPNEAIEGMFVGATLINSHVPTLLKDKGELVFQNMKVLEDEEVISAVRSVNKEDWDKFLNHKAFDGMWIIERVVWGEDELEHNGYVVSHSKHGKLGVGIDYSEEDDGYEAEVYLLETGRGEHSFPYDFSALICKISDEIIQNAPEDIMDALSKISYKIRDPQSKTEYDDLKRLGFSTEKDFKWESQAYDYFDFHLDVPISGGKIAIKEGTITEVSFEKMQQNTNETKNKYPFLSGVSFSQPIQEDSNIVYAHFSDKCFKCTKKNDEIFIFDKMIDEIKTKAKISMTKDEVKKKSQEKTSSKAPRLS